MESLIASKDKEMTNHVAFGRMSGPILNLASQLNRDLNAWLA
jgi:hypothetical protein